MRNTKNSTRNEFRAQELRSPDSDFKYNSRQISNLALLALIVIFLICAYKCIALIWKKSGEMEQRSKEINRILDSFEFYFVSFGISNSPIFKERSRHILNLYRKQNAIIGHNIDGTAIIEVHKGPLIKTIHNNKDLPLIEFLREVKIRHDKI